MRRLIGMIVVWDSVRLASGQDRFTYGVVKVVKWNAFGRHDRGSPLVVAKRPAGRHDEEACAVTLAPLTDATEQGTGK